MTKRREYAKQLEEGIAEMETAIERLKEEIQHLREERKALLMGNRLLRDDEELLL